MLMLQSVTLPQQSIALLTGNRKQETEHFRKQHLSELHLTAEKKNISNLRHYAMQINIQIQISIELWDSKNAVNITF